MVKSAWEPNLTSSVLTFLTTLSRVSSQHGFVIYTLCSPRSKKVTSYSKYSIPHWCSSNSEHTHDPGPSMQTSSPSKWQAVFAGINVKRLIGYPGQPSLALVKFLHAHLGTRMKKPFTTVVFVLICPLEVSHFDGAFSPSLRQVRAVRLPRTVKT